MEFRVGCPCGLAVTVTEAKADGEVKCTCGRAVRVPPLTDLRVRAGLPRYHISPELLIEHLLGSGELPPDKYCLDCYRLTDRVTFVTVECERLWLEKRTNVFVYAALLLVKPLLAVALLRKENRDHPQEYGRDKIYRLPLPVCEKCRAKLRPRRAKKWLRRVAVYEQLLDKFPNAVVKLAKPEEKMGQSGLTGKT
jgi:hypothetical protein